MDNIETFAKALGISDDDPEAWKRFPLAGGRKDEELLMDAPRLFLELVGQDFDNSAFVAQLCARHIPRFFEALLGLPSGSEAFGIFVILLDALTGQTFTFKYIRTHPQAKEVLAQLAQKIAEYPVAVSQDPRSDSFQIFNTLVCCFGNLYTSFSLLATSLEPLHSPIPSAVSTPASSRINIHLRSLRSYEHSLPPGSERDGIARNVEMATRALAMLSDAGAQIGAGMRRSAEGQGFMWLRCELGQENGCMTVGSQDFMACGRCVAVRYCCPEHQRADWKRHKPQCIETTW